MGQNAYGGLFLSKVGIFIKNGSGDDFRLMTRVLPRPLGLQGGKSSRKRSEHCVRKHE